MSVFVHRFVAFKSMRSLSRFKPLVVSHYHFSTIPTKEERLYALLEHYKDKPAGMWHELYQAQIFLKDLFDNGCDSDEGREFARNWCQIRGYICGTGSNLQQIEKEAIATECHCWCPSIPKQEFEDLCEIAGNLSDEEVEKLCDVIKESFPMESRKALLLNSLCGASLDGLSFDGVGAFKFGVDAREIKGFERVAKHFGVDNTTAHEIHSLYTLETKLKLKYDEFYQNIPRSVR
eukprot:60811_1